MKKNHIQITFFTLILMTYSLVSIGQSQTVNNIFTNKEKETLNKIINFYDSIVLSRTSYKFSVKKAYYHYFDSIFPIVLKSGDLTLLAINEKSRTKFLSSLNQQDLKEIYFIRDSVTYRRQNQIITKYTPYVLSFNYNGKYAEFLKKLSKENRFIEQYYEIIKNCGDFCPTNYTLILTKYRKLNFKNKFQRLVIIINLLAIDNIIYD